MGSGGSCQEECVAYVAARRLCESQNRPIRKAADTDSLGCSLFPVWGYRGQTHTITVNMVTQAVSVLILGMPRCQTLCSAL